MVTHTLELLLLSVILTGPLPLCLLITITIRRDEEKSGFAHDLLVSLTCWCMIQVLIGILLGLFHCLTFTAVLMTEMATFSTGLILFIRRSRTGLASAWQDLRRLPSGLSLHEKLIIGVIGLTGIILIMRLLVIPIADYDSLAYHLPAMSRWYQSGTLVRLDQSRQISSYPYNWEVLATLFLFPFGEDFLVALPGLLAWIILGLSVYLLSIKTGAERIYALAGSGLVLIMPLVLEHVNTMHIDLALAAFFLTGVYFIICYFQSGSPSYLPIVLGTAGLMLGIKTSGLLYGVVLLGVFAILSSKRISPLSPLKSPVRISRSVIPLWLWGAVSFLITGGFWYFRNLVELGNPIGNLKIYIGKTLIFPGNISSAVLSKTTLASSFDPTHPGHWKIWLVQVKIQLGVPFLTTAAAIILLLIGLGRSGTSKRSTLIFVIMGLALATFALYWFTPYSGSNKDYNFQITPWLGQAMRFAFPCLGISGILAAGGLAAIRIRKSAVAAIVIIASFPELVKMCRYVDYSWNRIIFIIIVLLIAWGIGRGGTAGKRFIPVLLCLAVTLSVITATYFIRQRRDIKRGQIYGGVMKYIDEETDRDKPIGYLFSHQSYLFYGKNLNRKVIYCPAKKRDLNQWLNFLKKSHIDVVAVGPLREAWESKKEIQWLNDPDGPFERVFGKNPQEEPFIYRVREKENL